MQVGWLCLKGEKRIFGLAADGRIRAQCRFHSSAPWLHGTMGRVLWEGGPRNEMSLYKVAPALWACGKPIMPVQRRCKVHGSTNCSVPFQHGSESGQNNLTS